MNRRAMLHQTFQGLAKTLPALLDALGGGLSGLLKHEGGVICQKQAACFPEAHRMRELRCDPISEHKEE